MPIYEYRCQDCGKKLSFLMLNRDKPFTPQCNRCGSKNLTRLFSRFASPKSEEDRMESLADPSKWSGLDENDPKSMVKFMKKMGKEFGDELGEDFNEEIEKAEEEMIKGDSETKESSNTGEANEIL